MLLGKINGLSILVIEQQNFIEGLKYVLTSTWMSSDASREAIIELFPPDVLVHPACLKFPLLFRLMREALIMLGIPVESRQGLYVPGAVSKAIYATDNLLLNTANRYIADYRHSVDGAARGHPTTVTTQDTGQASRASAEAESTWRRVDAANLRFDEEEKYSGMLAESPNLAEARNAYMTYCNQKGPRADRIRLVSFILKGPALNFWNSHIDGKPEYTELGAVFRELESQFDTPAHQRQIESLDSSMTMEAMREKHKCSGIAALGLLYHEVSRLNAQFPKLKRGPVFRTQTLMKIVEKYEWSRTSEEEVMQDKLTTMSCIRSYRVVL